MANQLFHEKYLNISWSDGPCIDLYWSSDLPWYREACGFYLTPVETVVKTRLQIYPDWVEITLQDSGFSFNYVVNKEMCVQHTMPHVLACQNNQNALEPLTSQSGCVPTEEENAVMCNIQRCLQKDVGFPRWCLGILAVCLGGGTCAH